MGITDVLSMAKEITELVRKYNDVPLYQKIVDLQSAVVELSGDRVSLYDQLQNAEVRIKELEEAARIKEILVFGTDSYWTQSGDGPFCLGCWDVRKVLVRVVRMPAVMTMYVCSGCKTPYHRVAKP